MSNTEVKKEKWIIDTDPGCDDMIAILYLLNRPNTEVLFLALSEGNCKINHVEVNAKKLKLITGINFTAYKGSSNQLYHGAKNAYDYHYEDGLGGIKELQELNVDGIKLNEYSDSNTNTNTDNVPIYKESSAIEIVKAVNEFPGEINILCLAPTTNIALAYMLDHSIADKFKDIVIMGGSYDFRGNVTATSEFNFYHDFISTALFFKKFKNVLVLPWEPCEELPFHPWDLNKAKEKAISLFGDYNKSMLKYLELIINKYSQEKEGVQICDLYAIIGYYKYSSVKEYSLAKQQIIIDSDLHKGSFCVTHKENTNSKFSEIMDNYFKQGKEYKEGYNIYIDRMDMSVIIDEFAYVLKPLDNK